MSWKLRVKTFEFDRYKSTLVLEHIFYGKTRNEAVHYFNSHMKTDSFLRGCNSGQWNNVKCINQFSWER